VYLTVRLLKKTIDKQILTPVIMLGTEIIKDPDLLVPSKRLGTNHTITVKWSVTTVRKWGIIQIIVPNKCEY
jgi:hypothetical protein